MGRNSRTKNTGVKALSVETGPAMKGAAGEVPSPSLRATTFAGLDELLQLEVASGRIHTTRRQGWTAGCPMDTDLLAAMETESDQQAANWGQWLTWMEVEDQRRMREAAQTLRGQETHSVREESCGEKEQIPAGRISFMAQTPAFIAIVDDQLCYRFVNAVYEVAFQMPASEFHGKPVRELSPCNYQKVARVLKDALAGEAQESELTLTTPTGWRVLQALFVPRRDSAAGSVSGVFVVGIDVSDDRKLQREMLEAAEREKAHLGHQLHDGLCQDLTALSFFARSMELQLRGKDGCLADQASNLANRLNDLTQSARKLAHDVAPISVEGRTLQEALAVLLESLSPQHPAVRFSLEALTPSGVLSEPVASQLYWIAQEAIANALHHAQGTWIEVSLWKENGCFCLSVTDDGAGQVADLLRKPGMGLRGMRYRARALDGCLEILNNGRIKPSGIRIVCRVPSTSMEGKGRTHERD